ncbi:hypothetical protein MRX96_025679 [Rhipicephalus microplus]
MRSETGRSQSATMLVPGSKQSTFEGECKGPGSVEGSPQPVARLDEGPATFLWLMRVDEIGGLPCLPGTLGPRRRSLPASSSAPRVLMPPTQHYHTDCFALGQCKCHKNNW